jgi:uncharacterized membrane protein YvbJ
MLCNKCGKEVPEKVRFCPFCGEKVIPEHSESFGQASVQKKQQEYINVQKDEPVSDYSKLTKFLLAGGTVLFIGMFAVLGVIFLKEKNIKQNDRSQMMQNATQGTSTEEVTQETAQEQGTELLTEVSTEAPEPTPVSFQNKIQLLNRSENALGEIAIYEEN